MENIIEVEKYPVDQESLGTSASGTTSLSHSDRSVNQQEKLKLERHSFTYGEIHHVIEKEANDNPCKAYRNHQSRIAGKTARKDEIVKYMSNLPSYLERGEPLQEKYLSVGVLDWGRLEKWQCSHKQISPRSSWNPPVRSNGSPSRSIDSTSPHFRKDCVSPSRHRLHRSSLYSHLLASPHSQFVKSFRENDRKCQDSEISHSNALNEQRKFIRRDHPTCTGNQEMAIKQSELKNPETQTLQECKTLPRRLNYDASSQFGKFIGAEKSQAQDYVAENHDIVEKPEAVVHLSNNLLKTNSTEISKVSISTTLFSQRACQKSLMERSTMGFPAAQKPEIPNSVDTPCEVSRKEFLLKQNFPRNVSNTSHSVTRSATAGCSPSKGKKFEAKASVVAPLTSLVEEACGGLDLKASTVTVDKARSSSPFSRLSISMGRRRRNSSSMENSSRSNQVAADMLIKSESVSAIPSTCLKDSGIEKPSRTSRAGSSPLRRLLDPLLKPKTASRHAIEPLEKDLNEMAVKAYNQQSDSLAVQARKLKLDMSRCRKVNVNDSALDKKHGPPVVQALLQVAFKHGLPLFTFAVNNVSNILAATMKLTSSGKEKTSHTYTFFTVQEVKKKNGSWINQGNKGKGCNYVSNVVAQMRVSESQVSQLTKLDEPLIREFVVFSVDLKQADQQTSDFHPIEELAAIVVKIPQKIKKSIGKDEFQRNVCSNSLKDDPRKSFSVVKSYPCSKESMLVQQAAGSRAGVSVTALLPSGIHSLPSKGGPSSLIERWNSGGSCDCGGWDLGCKLRVLADQNQVIEKSSSSEPSPIIDQFKLFSQEGLPVNNCVLSLTTFKDMVYSVEFSSSLSLLQAFSICLATIDSRNSYELSESSILFQAKTSGETNLAQNDRLKTPPNLAEKEVLAEQITCPPLSPFGRV